MLRCFVLQNKMVWVQIIYCRSWYLHRGSSLKVQADVPYALKHPTVSMVPIDEFYCVYAATQQESLFDVRSGKCIIQHTFPTSTFIAAIAHNESVGIITPQVARAILGSDDYIFPNSDKGYIARLCEMNDYFNLITIL